MKTINILFFFKFGAYLSIEFEMRLTYKNLYWLSPILFSAPWQPTHPLVPTPLPPREWIWPTALLTWDWRPKSTASTRCPLSTKPETGDEMRGQREARDVEKRRTQRSWISLAFCSVKSRVDVTFRPLLKQWNCIVVPLIWLFSSSQMKVCFWET